MPKFKFTTEYEIRAKLKLIYPYLSTPAGLEEWFADGVQLNQKNMLIYWDQVPHIAKISAQRVNKMIRYEFENESDNPKDRQYLEMKVEYNEFTDSTFLSIIDYSDMDDIEQLQDLWDRLISKLKECVGHSDQ